MRRLFFVLTLFAAAACSDEAKEAAADPHDHGGHDHDAGHEPEEDSGSPAAPEAGGASCSSALEALLTPRPSVSTAEVSVLSESEGERTLFVDASAGGSMAAATSPRVYLNLLTGTRVDVSDVGAQSSTDWDLAIKRPILFANGGHGGPGEGGAVHVETEYEGVSRDVAEAAPIAQESFVDANCEPKLDQTNAVRTSFDGWYDYDPSNNHLTPRAGTFVVKGGRGALYRVQILSYYANPDGSEGEAGGRYTLRVGAL